MSEVSAKIRTSLERKRLIKIITVELLVSPLVIFVLISPLLAQLDTASSPSLNATSSNPSTKSTDMVSEENSFIQESSELLDDQPPEIKPIVSIDPMEKRLARNITLKVRDMNIMDVIRFLAKKGDFNVVTSSAIEGRATLELENVSIKDALDIAVISNRLAYQVQNDIVQVMTAAEYEAMYGKQFSDKTEVSIVHLHYAKPSYVLATLDNIKSSVGKIIIDEDTGSVVMIDTNQTIKKMQAALKDMEKPMETFTFMLQYAQSDVVAEKLKARIDANAVGSITADDRSNQLIVRAFPGRLNELESMIKDLDLPTKEVLVEARIMQIVFRPNYDVGIDWNLDFKDSTDPQIKKLSFANVFLNDPQLASSDNLSSAYGKVAFGALGFDHFQTVVRNLAKVSDTKILSNPKILVTNNQEAKIHIGDTIPYIISTTSGTGDNAITSEDVRTVDVGLQLSVTPTINDDGFVTMRLKPEISTVVGKIQSKGGGIPQVNKTELQTTVMVQDGMSIVMGGLKRDDKLHTKKGFPYLMDLPFFGRLFSRTTDTIESTEIVIFITPHIITKDDDFMTMKGTIKPFKDYSDLKFQGLK